MEKTSYLLSSTNTHTLPANNNKRLPTELAVCTGVLCVGGSPGRFCTWCCLQPHGKGSIRPRDTQNWTARGPGKSVLPTCTLDRTSRDLFSSAWISDRAKRNKQDSGKELCTRLYCTARGSSLELTHQIHGWQHAAAARTIAEQLLAALPEGVMWGQPMPRTGLMLWMDLLSSSLCAAPVRH